MANVIQIKRGSGAPGSLADGELGFDKTNNILYIGNGSSVVAFNYVNKTGDTMTGNLTIHPSATTGNNASGRIFIYDNSSNGEVLVGFSTNHQTHGIYSYGYAPSATTWTSDPKWILYRNSDGDVVLKGNADTATSAASATKATQDGDGNTISSTYLKLAGGTMTGRLTLYKSTTIAANNPAVLDFSVKQTDNDKTTHAYISVYDDHDNQTYGTNMVIYGAGNMFIGGGESPNNLYIDSYQDSTTENLYLTADTTLYAYSTAGTIGNRIGFAISSGNIIPQKAEAANNNAQSLGVSGNRWSKLYVGSADSYGASTLPVYWNAGIPNVISSLTIEGQGNIQTTEGRVIAGTTNGTRECYVEARASTNRIMLDAKPERRGIWTDAGWVFYADTGTSVFTIKGNIDQLYYGSSAPSSPRTGQIWLKPI